MEWIVSILFDNVQNAYNMICIVKYIAEKKLGWNLKSDEDLKPLLISQKNYQHDRVYFDDQEEATKCFNLKCHKNMMYKKLLFLLIWIIIQSEFIHPMDLMVQMGFNSPREIKRK